VSAKAKATIEDGSFFVSLTSQKLEEVGMEITNKAGDVLRRFDGRTVRILYAVEVLDDVEFKKEGK
jgi:hypothetical protein